MEQQLQEKMVSLFEYLRRPAGSVLGKQVAEYAKLRKAKFGTKQVANPVYQGHVMIYTEAFLKECFNAKKVFEPNQEDLTEINTELANNPIQRELPF
jgi:hypothetical protein